MKLLILSCGTGEGHNSAAYALQEAAGRAGAQADVLDPNTLQNPLKKPLVDGGYNNLIHYSPSAFGALYKLGAWYEGKSFPDVIMKLNGRTSLKLSRYIAEGGYTAAVATHLYAGEMLTVMRKKGYSSVPVFGVHTDYTIIPFFGNLRLDLTFIPHKDLLPLYTAHGMDPARVIPTGIPVSARYRSIPSIAEARKSLNLPLNARVLMIMSGSLGLKDHVMDACRILHQVIEEEGPRPDSPLWSLVLVRNNEKLKRSIEHEFPASDHIIPVPFTRIVNQFAAASDVIISKPGGLTSTETAVAGKPLIHHIPLPGCETENARFFSERGMSYLASSMEDAVHKAVEIADDPSLGQEMVRRQKAEINAFAADDIIRYIMDFSRGGMT